MNTNFQSRFSAQWNTPLIEVFSYYKYIYPHPATCIGMVIHSQCTAVHCGSQLLLPVSITHLRHVRRCFNAGSRVKL